ncbi:hypothetical protein JOB18_022108 [Solea senegalensis]|nr:hypothetical protein JOB18_038597 [Solea senegalensis]KAG7522437.1 hypothetical protein JOB18_022108 [Solea senegalensis]
MSASQERNNKKSSTPGNPASQKQQGKKSKKGSNSGNPIFTYTRTPKVLELELNPRRLNPMYKTSNGAYGRYMTSFEGIKRVFFPRTDKFSEHLRTIGMQRNTAFVTAMKKSKVCDTTLQYTLLCDE